MDLAANSQANANTEMPSAEGMTQTEMELVALLYAARNAAYGIRDDAGQNAFRVRFHFEALINAMVAGKDLPRVRA
jgi:hypothetical protein